MNRWREEGDAKPKKKHFRVIFKVTNELALFLHVNFPLPVVKGL